MPETTKPQELEFAFVLGPDDLGRIANLLQKEVLDRMPELESWQSANTLTYKVGFSDSSTRTTESVDEVLALPNPPTRKITSISISTPYWYRKIRADIRLQNKEYLPISYDLRGEDNEVITLSQKLDDHLLALRQWYTPLAKNTLIGSILISLIPSALFLLVVRYFSSSFIYYVAGEDNYIDRAEILTVLPEILTVLLFSVVLSTVLSFLLVEPIRRRLFPVGVFTIGQGVARQKNLNYFRGAALTAVILPIIISWLFLLLSDGT